MSSPFNVQSGQPYNISASQLLVKGQGNLQKIIATASASGVVSVYDNTSATGSPVLGPLTLVAGQTYQVDINFQIGCFVNLVSGTMTMTATVGP